MWGTHYCLRVYCKHILWLLVPCLPLLDISQCSVHWTTHFYDHLWVWQRSVYLLYHKRFQQHWLMLLFRAFFHRVDNSMCTVGSHFSLYDWLSSSLLPLLPRITDKIIYDPLTFCFHRYPCSSDIVVQDGKFEYSYQPTITMLNKVGGYSVRSSGWTRIIPQWASYRIRKIASCAGTRNAANVLLATAS